jgi:phenylacetate-coenzyme A ligase PaaK-like adenylate-forming protein
MNAQMISNDRLARHESYEALRRRHLQDMRARVPTAFERLGWSRERLRVERQQSLRDLIRTAKARSRWHRDRLRHVDAETFTEEALASIPPMTKHDVMDHFDTISTDPRLTLEVVETHLAGLETDQYLLDRYHANASGGSSGRRGISVFDWDAWAMGYLSFFRRLIQVRMRDPSAAGKPLVGAIIAAQDPTHASGSLPVTFNDPASALWHRFPVTLPFEQIVAGLNAAQPEVLGGYPSLLHQLAAAAESGALSISPKIVFSSSEPLLPEIREAIGSAWHATLLNMWATTEGLGMAASCGHGPGMHLNDDLVIVEPVDETGAPVAPGVRSAKVLITPLYTQEPLPLLRYEITDEVTLLDQSCPCGSAHRLITDIQGRLDDTFDYGAGIKVHPHIFRSRLAQERAVIEYQITQTPTGADIAIRCGGKADLGRLHHALIADLRRLGLGAPQVTITEVAGIERPPSGKLKRFVAMNRAAAPNSPFRSPS